MTIRFILAAHLGLTMFLTATLGRPTIIAHRGASGYLPEHTLEAASYAHALGVDFIEQDVVMSQDDVLVVCHDVHIDTTTDVATRHPARRRADGRYYAVDFTWEELKALQVRERFDPATGRPVYPRRFPHNQSSFRLCTMEEQIRLIQGLNQSTGRTVGLYPEIKVPAWHAREGKDPGRALLALLAKHGYTRRTDPVVVQCFDATELQRLRQAGSSKLTFVLLLEPRGSRGYPPEEHLSPEGLRRVASYAQGIGPHLSLLVQHEQAGAPRFLPLARHAHEAGLMIHAYTFRADQLPAGVSRLEDLLREVVDGTDLDGYFSDQPDIRPR